MRTASQILARHCPVPRIFPRTDDDDSDIEYYVPMKDAIAAIKDATGEAENKPDLSIVAAIGRLAITFMIAPLIFIFAGFGAILDNFETIIARVKLPQD